MGLSIDLPGSSHHAEIIDMNGKSYRMKDRACKKAA